MTTQYQPRANENLFDTSVKRTDRIRISDEGYFYQTREGELMGPFETLSSANYDLNCFIEIAALEQEILSCGYLMVA